MHYLCLLRQLPAFTRPSSPMRLLLSTWAGFTALLIRGLCPASMADRCGGQRGTVPPDVSYKWWIHTEQGVSCFLALNGYMQQDERG